MGRSRPDGGGVRIGRTTRRVTWLWEVRHRRCRVRCRCESTRIAVEVTRFGAGNHERMSGRRAAPGSPPSILGSASPELIRGDSESLTGRVEFIVLAPDAGLGMLRSRPQRRVRQIFPGVPLRRVSPNNPRAAARHPGVCSALPGDGGGRPGDWFPAGSKPGGPLPGLCPASGGVLPCPVGSFRYY